MAGQPVPGSRLLQGIAVSRKYTHRVRWSRLPAVVAMLRSLCRRAGQNRLRQHGIISLHRRVVGELGIANRRTNLQAAIRRRFDLIERQAVDVEHLRRRFDVQLHQVDQRRPAGEEPHVRALLRGLRLRGARDRRRGICGPN